MLDFGQTPKVTVVLNMSTRTSELVEASDFIALQLPTKAMVAQTYRVGSDSAKDVPDKLIKQGVKPFKSTWHRHPTGGGPCWLACRLVPEPHTQQTYDLFIGDVIEP